MVVICDKKTSKVLKSLRKNKPIKIMCSHSGKYLTCTVCMDYKKDISARMKTNMGLSCNLVDQFGNDFGSWGNALLRDVWESHADDLVFDYLKSKK